MTVTRALAGAMILVHLSGLVAGFPLPFWIVPRSILAGHELWTLIASLFLHAHLLHLAANILFLVVFAPEVERQLGHVRFAFIFLMGGALGMLAQVFSLSEAFLDMPVLGASGAIAGVMGAYAALFPGRTVRTRLLFWETEIRVVWGFFAWFVVSVIGGLGAVTQTGHAAHVGGFLAGLTLARAFRFYRFPFSASTGVREKEALR